MMRVNIACILATAVLTIGLQGASKGTYSTNTIGTIEFGKYASSDIYEDAQNLVHVGRPNRWKFAITPIFVPELDDSRKIVFATRQIRSVRVPVSGRMAQMVTTRVTFPLFLMSDDVKAATEAKLRNYYNDERLCNFQVAVLPIEKLKLEPDLDFMHLPSERQRRPEDPRIAFLDPDRTFLSTPRALDLQFDVTEEEITTAKPKPGAAAEPRLKLVEQFLSEVQSGSLKLKGTITMSAQRVETDYGSAQSLQIIGTDLYNKLSGSGGVAYVSRNDLQRLALDASQKLTGEVYTESGQMKFSSDLFNRIWSSSDKVDPVTTKFTEEMWRQSFNADDLKPDVIEHELDERLDIKSVEGKTMVHYKTESSGGLLGDTFKASGGQDQTVEDFKKTFDQHGVKLEWNGRKFIVKAIDVVRVDIAKLSKQLSFSVRSRQVVKGSEKDFDRLPIDIYLDVRKIPKIPQMASQEVAACDGVHLKTVTAASTGMADKPLQLFASLSPEPLLFYTTVQKGAERAQKAANGTHKCQSKTSLGHSCSVTGIFTDCDEAAKMLKLKDCCPKTKDGGNSIEFTLDSCK